MLSPRLLWCRRHCVVVVENLSAVKDERWWARFDGQKEPVGRGPTAEGACRDFGAKANLRLWNETNE